MELTTKHPLWRYRNISSVHIELSTKCNAACPGCARFIMNSPIVDENLVQTEITFENFKKWFPKEILPQILNWIICGNLGDPLACKDIYKILEYICTNTRSNIQINTNGGLGSKLLYSKIGKLFFQTPELKRVITFSIDGLEDTNHIYRRNVKWNKVWENLMSYVDTGAKAHWDFLQFKHNVHQVEKAREIANQYGINFILKNPFGVDGTAMPVYDKNLKFEYSVEHAFNNKFDPYIPASPDYIAPFPIPIKNKGSINCMSKRSENLLGEEKTIIEIYVDVLGRVMPCCFVGNRMFIRHMSDAVQVQEIQKSIGNKNNLNHFSLKEILENKILDVYSKSWNNKKILICWNQCGKNEEKNSKIDLLLKT